MNNGWKMSVLIFVLVSVPIAAGPLKSLRLWWLKKKIERLEDKSRHPIQLHRMGSCELDHCQREALGIADKLRSDVLTLHEDEQKSLRRRAVTCSDLFLRGLIDKAAQEDAESE